MIRKITSIDDLSLKEINKIADDAIKFSLNKKKIKKSKVKNIFNLFLEPSTRTTVSFELAAKKLGHNIININFDKSSLSKGETFNDTIATLVSMKPDALIIRDQKEFSPKEIYNNYKIPIINAGDGINEHPTQSLLDYALLKKKFGNKKITIGICGDIKHSRVAHSNIKLFTKLKYNIELIAPDYFLDKKELLKINKNISYSNSLDNIRNLDVIMMLRIQKERINKNLKSSVSKFKSQYCLNLNHLKSSPYLMHPGPVNRNIEISDQVLDTYHKSLILDQVNMGVYVRMACLEYLF